MASQDVFDQIPASAEGAPTSEPISEPRMSNRRKAMAAKQSGASNPFDSVPVMPDAVREQIGKQPAAPAQPPAQPTVKIGGKRGKRAKAADVRDDELRAPRPGIGQRMKDFFVNRNSRQIYHDAMAWISDHEMWFILVTVLLIAVGLLVNRYISFGGSIVLLAIGWLVNREDSTEDSFMFYIYALACFVVPYLF